MMPLVSLYFGGEAAETEMIDQFGKYFNPVTATAGVKRTATIMR